MILPDDAEHGGYSDESMLWLASYSIDVDDMLEHEILWSEKQQALVFPFHDLRGKVFAYQQRNFGSGRPKWETTGKIHDAVTWLTPGGDGIIPETVVVVEDIVSATRVSRIADSVCLFGTHLRMSVVREALSCYKNIVFWLDRDALDKAVRMSHEVNLQIENKPECYVIHTQHDPKAYSDEEIHDYIINATEGN